MIRRIALVVAAAFMLILAPTAVAMAYQAPGFTCTVPDSTPTVGDSVTVVSSGANAGEVLTLTGVGTGELTATANTSGVATFTFTVTVAGVKDLQVFNDAGDLVCGQTLTVLGAGAAAPPVKGGQLSNTGFEGMPLAVGGGMLVLVGAGAVLVARRRRSAQVPA